MISSQLLIRRCVQKHPSEFILDKEQIGDYRNCLPIHDGLVSLIEAIEFLAHCTWLDIPNS